MYAAAGRTKLRGINLFIDETALEQRAVHFRHNNQAGGICCRHAPAVNLLLNTYESALKVSEDIKKGTAHLANELTVVAASCFGEGGTYPILALPSCKGLNADDSQKIYETKSQHELKRIVFPVCEKEPGHGDTPTFPHSERSGDLVVILDGGRARFRF
ncbi:hypothetical protein B0H14DRAFT_3693951 [Mycena olivaceomarginata]|nr:hypothetical protein B0H14DRAFT_3693951 [Mycena olivaceomarginata]